MESDLISVSCERRQSALDRIHLCSKKLHLVLEARLSSIRTKAARSCLSEIVQLSNNLFAYSDDNIDALEVRLSEEEVLISKLYSSISKEGDIITDILHSDLVSSLVIDDSSIDRVNLMLGYIREWEKSFEFQSLLWKEKGELSAILKKSREQFVYGTTSFSLWEQVCTQPCWSKLEKRKAKAAAKKGGPTVPEAIEVVIFGSSQGLLSFYTSTFFPAHRVTGYEVIALLNNKAVDLRDTYFPHTTANPSAAFPGSSNGTAKGELDNIHPIQFHLQDMMTADLSRADVVVLTSLCWDEETRAAVVAKLVKELRKGCVVIDYCSNTFSSQKSKLSQQYYGAAPVPPTGECSAPPRAPCSSSQSDDLMKLLADTLSGTSLPVTTLPSSKVPAKDSEGPTATKGIRMQLESIVEGVTSWSQNQKIYIHVCRTN